MLGMAGSLRHRNKRAQGDLCESMLRFTDLDAPGITRKRIGRAWGYFDAKGKRITDRDEIDRLNAVGLPPAYEDAWFCPDPDGHIQATGIDARGRKQYRYHPEYRARQEADKYAGCLEFGKALAKIRRRVDKDLKRRKLDKDTRGRRRRPPAGRGESPRRQSPICARQQELRRDDSPVAPCEAQARPADDALHRQARHRPRNRPHRPRLARVVKRAQELPGQALFQYINGDGVPQAVNTPTSTTISARRLAGISRPSISVPGAPASSPSISC